MKSVGIRSFSGTHFPAFSLNTERYGVHDYKATQRLTLSQIYLSGWELRIIEKRR